VAFGAKKEGREVLRSGFLAKLGMTAGHKVKEE
jgi:hypothetical protein